MVVAEIQALSDRGEIDKALDVLFAFVDEKCSTGKFDSVDQLLKTLNVESLSIDVLIGVLSITLAARNELTERQQFYAAVQDKLVKDQLDEGRRERLLAGLH